MGGSATLVLASSLIACHLLSTAAQAGQESAQRSSQVATEDSEPLEFEPPAPVFPQVITRDEEGRATLRAVRLHTPLQFDGNLDEAVYDEVPAISDFIQNEPDEGAPASERTELWILFDDDHVYVSGRCWESDPDRMVVTTMQRDSRTFWQADHLAFIFDTFYDRRNSVEFAINALGGRADGQITDERQSNNDWNPIWDFGVGRFAGGWTFEIEIPFSSLRYRPGFAQVWGFNARRTNRSKGESSHVTRLPIAMGGTAIFQASLAATLVGLEAPPGSKNLEIKPYVISSLASDPSVENPPDVEGDVGLDVKYGISQNLTADLTYNTDFAQVEADQQQVNLTRFSLFFPEKRDFFLENQGTFAFGGAGAGPFGGGGDTPILFYSRRIGLDGGQEVPIDGGGRLTGRVGAFSVGALNIQTADAPESGVQSTNFSIARVKRDVLRRSSIGAIFTRRSASTEGPGSSETYGVDGTFAFYDNLSVNTYWATTRTPGASRNQDSYRAQLDYAGDLYGVEVERLVVGPEFNPGVGFMRRSDFERSFGLFRFSPRPRSISAIRKFSGQGSVTYIENGAGRLETRELDGEFGVEFENGDQLTAGYLDAYEFFPLAFEISPGIVVPVGGYNIGNARLGFNLGRQRRFSGNIQAEVGTFLGGDKTTVAFSGGLVSIAPQFSIEPTASINWLDLPQGSFTASLVGSRFTYTMTPRMFGSGLVQYNSEENTVAANIRFRWEYSPGSELFIVYNETYDRIDRRLPLLSNRAFIVKITRLFTF